MIKFLKAHYNKFDFAELFRYSSVGFSSVLLNLILTFMLTEVFGLYYILSGILAYAASSIYNFSMNKVWTFKEKLHHKIIMKYSYFLMLSLCALAVSTFLLYFFTEFLGMYYMASQFIAITLVSVVIFFANKFWVFRRQ